MARLALLLRGINVGGKNKIAMADLRALLTNLGYEDPKTLLNSGNAFITTDGKPERVEQHVSAAVKAELGLAIETLVRTHEELSAVVNADPLKKIATEPKYYAVAFLRSAPAAGLLEKVDPAEYAPECWELVGRELYLWYARGQADTKLSGAFWERKLKVTLTARNWNTVVKLRDLTAP